MRAEYLSQRLPRVSKPCGPGDPCAQLQFNLRPHCVAAAQVEAVYRPWGVLVVSGGSVAAVLALAATDSLAGFSRFPAGVIHALGDGAFSVGIGAPG